jgi:hypothetical protein
MDTARSVVAEALRQVIHGTDIPTPESLLSNITPQKAAAQLPSSPYSILTNLAHADFWQQIWIDRLEGRRAKNFTQDWKTHPPEEWPDLRAHFLQGLELAHQIATSEPFSHKLKSD